MPGAGIEPAQSKRPRDFKSLASTKFRHPGNKADKRHKMTDRIQEQSIINLCERFKAAQGFAPWNSGFADRRLSYLAMPPKRQILVS